MVEEKLEVNHRPANKRGQKLSRRLSGKSPNLPPTLVFPRQTQQLLMTRTTPSQVLNLQFPQLQGTPFVIFLQLVLGACFLLLFLLHPFKENPFRRKSSRPGGPKKPEIVQPMEGEFTGRRQSQRR